MPGNEWKADLTIKITTAEMSNILAGTFDARKAIAEGNIELKGDVSLLRRVGFLFQSGGSEAEIRTPAATGVGEG